MYCQLDPNTMWATFSIFSLTWSEFELVSCTQEKLWTGLLSSLICCCCSWSCPWVFPVPWGRLWFHFCISQVQNHTIVWMWELLVRDNSEEGVVSKRYVNLWAADRGAALPRTESQMLLRLWLWLTITENLLAECSRSMPSMVLLQGDGSWVLLHS